MGNSDTVRRRLAAVVCAIAAAVALLVAPSPAAATADGWYRPPHTDTIYRVQGGVPHAATYAEWSGAGSPAPARAPTSYVKYSWSPTIYAVTFWETSASSWMWEPLTYAAWQKAGFPKPQVAGWIKGSRYYKWGTSPEIFVEGADGVNHALTYDEWAASGYQPFTNHSNEGFLKLSWTPTIARMTNLQSGGGYPIGFPEWQAEAFPTPVSVQRVVGDQFNQYGTDPTIIYSGPTMNRAITYNEWIAAGSPAPVRHGDPACAPPAGVPASARQVVVVNSAATNADVDMLVNTGGVWQCARMDMPGRVGRSGVRALTDRRSGDGTTPAGVFGLGTMTGPDGQMFQFFGNGSNPGVRGTWRQVRTGDCWVATPGVPAYNTLVTRSASTCTGEDEYLPNFTGSYSQAALIDANMGPNRSGDQPGEPPLAAAIFLHRHSYDAAGNTKPTSGCVSLNANNLAFVLSRLVPGEAYFVIR